MTRGTRATGTIVELRWKAIEHDNAGSTKLEFEVRLDENDWALGHVVVAGEVRRASECTVQRTRGLPTWFPSDLFERSALLYLEWIIPYAMGSDLTIPGRLEKERLRRFKRGPEWMQMDPL